MKALLTNKELRERYEAQMLTQKQLDQISDDIFQTADQMGVAEQQSNPDFINSFWANYCPEDDGNEWVREDG